MVKCFLSTQHVEAALPAPVQPRSHEVATETSELDNDVEDASTLSVERIPRPGLSQSFRKMKTILFRKASSSERHTRSSLPDSLDVPNMYVHTFYCFTNGIVYFMLMLKLF